MEKISSIGQRLSIGQAHSPVFVSNVSVFPGRSSVSEGTSYWGSKRSWIAVLGSPVNTSTSTHLGPDDSELESLHVSQSDALNKLISFT